MKAGISPEAYQRFGAYHKRLKAMGAAQFTTWITGFWRDAYNEGFDAAEQAYTQEGVNVSEDVDAAILDADSLRDILLSVKGIGQKRADEVIAKIGEIGNVHQ